MNKKARSKNQLKPKAHFKWVFMDTIPETSPKVLTSENNFYNYLLIVDRYSKTEEVMDNLYMFQPRFGKIDEFGWWYLEIISTDAGTQFSSS